MGNTLQKHKKSEGEDNFTCEICLESHLPVDKKFKNSSNDKQYKECASEHHFCIDCIAKYIEVKVNAYGKSVIKCPKFKCDVDLEIQSCCSIVSTKVFVRWCDLLCESEILAKFGRHGKRVYCPGCSEVILNECGDDGITRTTCPSCEKLFCFRCMIPLMDQKVHTCCNRNDLLFLDTVARKGWTRCPSCKQSVERTFGCNYIQCRCGNEFCYQCGLEWWSQYSTNHTNCFPHVLQNQSREEELDPFMLRVHSVFIGFAMMSILGNPKFTNNTNLYNILPARLEFGRTFVVRPKGKHLATVVWLHELNQNGFSWYHLLEELPIRNIKWICPTAPRRRVSIYNGFPSTAWFNMLNFAEDARVDIDCLDAAAIHVSNLLSTEPSEIKLGVGGFGMGAAVALYSAACAVEGKLTNGRPYPGNISAAVGLSGWLPIARFLMDKIIGSQEAVARAQSLPLLLCHGKDDDFVFYERGANSSEIFRSPLFQKLTSRTYDRLGHATNTEEMNEVCNWLTTNLALDGSD